MLFLFKGLCKKAASLQKQTNLIKTVCKMKKNDEMLRIRTMSYPELEQTRLTWAKQEGWPSQQHGMSAIYQLDPDGFYCLEKQGMRMACIGVLSYPSIKFAYMGFLLVPQQWRGRGYGKLLFNETMKYTQTTRGIDTFGLNCLEKMSTLYGKYGFKTDSIDEVWNLTIKDQEVNFKNPIIQKDLIDEMLFQKLVHYDAAVFGVHRQEYLSVYLDKPNTSTLIYHEDDLIKGYGVISEEETATAETPASYRIGPVYAKDKLLANTLLKSLTNTKKSKDRIFLETPGTNTAAKDIVKALGFEKLYAMHKMYKGEKPKQSKEKQMFCYSTGQARVTS